MTEVLEAHGIKRTPPGRTADGRGDDTKVATRGFPSLSAQRVDLGTPVYFSEQPRNTTSMEILPEAIILSAWGTQADNALSPRGTRAENVQTDQSGQARAQELGYCEVSNARRHGILLPTPR